MLIFGGSLSIFWGRQEELEAERDRLAREHEELEAKLVATQRQRESEKQQVGDPGVPPCPSTAVPPG